MRIQGAVERPQDSLVIAALMHNVALAGAGVVVVVVVVAMRRIGTAVAALTVTATVMLEQISCCTCWHGSVQRRMANSVTTTGAKGVIARGPV